MNRVIEGPPRAESIRGRLHKLENDDAAALAARAALDAMTVAKRQSWLFAFAILGTFGTITGVAMTILVILTGGNP